MKAQILKSNELSERARTLYEQQSYNAAISLLNISLAIETNAEALFLRGCCHAQLAEYGAAVEDYEACEAAGGCEAALFLEKGNSLQLMGNREAAAEAYETALVIDPLMTEASYNLGSMYLEMDEYEIAAVFFVRTVQQRQWDADALNNLAVCLAAMDDNEAAGEMLAAALERDCLHTEALENLLCMTSRI